jgi:Uma2 family endonuclease
LIEVAETSRNRDLEWKRRIYATSEIAEYWVVDADGQVVVVHRNASEGDYQDVKTIGPAGKIAPSAAANCRLDIGWLFP